MPMAIWRHMIGFEEKWVKINVLKNGVLIWKR